MIGLLFTTAVDKRNKEACLYFFGKHISAPVYDFSMWHAVFVIIVLSL